MKSGLTALLSLALGAASVVAPASGEPAVAAPAKGPASVCTMTGAHQLRIALPRKVDTTISRRHGQVRVAGFRCVRAGGESIGVRDLTAVRVRVRGGWQSFTPETVLLPDLVRWRTDHPADDRGPARVRMTIDLGSTDIAPNTDDEGSRFDRVQVDGTDQDDTWSVVKAQRGRTEHGATVSFDGGLEADLLLRSEPILRLRSGRGDDTLRAAPGDESGSHWTDRQPMEADTGPGADTVVATSISFQDLSLGDGDDHVELLAWTDDGGAGRANIRPGDGDDLITLTDRAEILVSSESHADGADSVVGPSDPADASIWWSYSRRTTPVRVTADGVADDGAPGEGDNVSPSAFGVSGGSGDDVLDLSGVLFPADQTWVNIFGGRGDDRLTTSVWTDAVWAGPGADTIVGPASDFAPPALVDMVHGEGGDDRFYLRDGQTNNADGGPGLDRAELDADDGAISVEQVERP